MKTKLFLMLGVSAMLFASCTDDNVNPIQNKKGELSGKITTNMTLDASTQYVLTGALLVSDGATLTIPAGTIIKAEGGSTSTYVLVERGGKIIANGTADKPIVFTSNSATPKEGDWGGVIINGKGIISGEAGKVAESGTEINTTIRYGGDVNDDNSGILNYVRFEYTGARISETKEHNGLTLNAVGNKTQLSNLYFSYAADDAIEFFGGSVNASNILVVNCSDDMVDFTEGYTGTISNVYGIREEGYLDATKDPRGIEGDGNMDGKFANHINQSNAIIKDITLINNAPEATMVDAIKIRRGAKATITNAFVKFGPKTVIVDNNNQVVVDLIDFTDDISSAAAGTTITYAFDPANKLDQAKIKDAGLGGVTKNDALKGANTAVFGWTGYTFK
ncbi:hypothetical protein ACFRAE_09845 [Sphingobacterium sp. HJSM2_6]|uniref:hypothetical protein n=1 Tax=Sphingobacterium sp. HJSM2_6 TaxID=3366264 RepID=UPI003BE29232